jgi:exopolysaccharide biosynthesis polyprenyl glycosylphosphotransferase
MFDRHNRLYSRILLALDVIAVMPSLLLAYHIRGWLLAWSPDYLSRHFNPILLPFEDYLTYVLLLLPVWFLSLVLSQRYDTLLRQPITRQVRRAMGFVAISGSLMGLLSFTLKLEISRPVFFSFLAIMFVVLPANRLLLYWVLRSRNLGEHNQIRIMIVGTDETARRVGELLMDARKWGYHLVGYIRTNGRSGAIPEELTAGRIEDLPGILQLEAPADELIFSGHSKKDLDDFEDVIHLCQELGIRTRIAADFLPPSAAAVNLEFLENLPLITFSSAPEHSLSIVIKRVLDFAVAALSLILSFPLMLLTAVAIKFTSPGPVFYRQVRCGLHGRRFELVKFRTMINGAEDRLWEIRHLNEMDGPVFKMRNDPRVTPLGRFLRKFSVDELPQLWNVIKGEMSLVGPRAPLLEEVQAYAIPQRRRLSVKPGITCLWQISGRSDVNFDQWMEMDLQYIDNWSLWLDLRIMLRTIPAVFSGRGAR